MKTFHGMSCCHEERWCQCTETNLLISKDTYSSHFMNPKGWKALFDRLDGVEQEEDSAGGGAVLGTGAEADRLASLPVPEHGGAA